MATLNDVFGLRLKNARLMMGYSHQQVADAIGVSKQMVSKYELGKSLPDSANLIKLANFLKQNVDYFFNKPSVSLKNVCFRKRASLSGKKEKVIREKILLDVENYLTLENLLEIDVKFINPLSNSVTSLDDAEKAANCLRQEWGLGLDPIAKVVAVLEDNGIKVVEVVEEIKEFDGLSSMIDDKYPVVVINSNFSVERKRFTMLHELGHLLMNMVLSDDKSQNEKFCNRFAGAMLIPADSLFKELGRIRSKVTLNELEFFQVEYGISIPALVYRLADLNIINENLKRSFFVKYRTDVNFKRDCDRPIFKGDESSDRFHRLVLRALAEETISISKAASLLRTSIEDIKRTFILI